MKRATTNRRKSKFSLTLTGSLRILFMGLILSASTAMAQSEPADRELSPRKFHRMMKRESVQVIDVRTPEEYATGAIPGSRLINFQQPDFEQQVRQLDKEGTYLLYCRSGKRSAKALELFRANGFHKVYHLQGGIQEWKGKKVSPATEHKKQD